MKKIKKRKTNKKYEFSSPYGGDGDKPDLRAYWKKAYDYISYLAREAHTEDTLFVKNGLKAVKCFPHSYSIIDNNVLMIERKLAKTLDLIWRADGLLPATSFFSDGSIIFGTIAGTNTVVKLKLEQLSGNVIVYGTYGMGKSNLNLFLIPQLIAQGVHVDIFDVTEDYRDILQVPGCENGLVIKPEEDLFNPLEPVGDPLEHLHFVFESITQDFNLRPENLEMSFNYTCKLYEKFGVFEGKEPPSLVDLINHLIKEQKRPGTTLTTKNKIASALRTLTYLKNTFKKMATCRRGYHIDSLDKFRFVSYEIGNSSENVRSWYSKIKFKQYHHKGRSAIARHKVFRVIVVDEAKGTFGKSRIGDRTNYTKDMFTTSRSIGCCWIISDQFPSELADFVRAASVQVSFQHTVPKDIREISVAMGFSNAQKEEIPRLGRYRAFQKITDFPSPYIIVTHKSAVQRHIGDSELRGLMTEKIRHLNDKCITTDKTNCVQVVSSSQMSQPPEQTTTESASLPLPPKPVVNPLDDIERFLRFVEKNPEMSLSKLYKALDISVRKGDALKNQMLENYLVEESTFRKSDRGRPSKILELTEIGQKFLNEK